MTPLFVDRIDAAKQLLPRVKGALGADCAPVIVALPRGGVPLGQVLAAGLSAPLELVMVRKVGLPKQPELAVAAVTNGQAPVMHINHDVAQSAGLSEADIERLAKPALAEIARRRALWYGTRPMLALAGKTAVVVDDGIATGASLRAALAWLKRQAVTRLIVAIPLAPREVLAQLAQDADEIICLATPSPFHSVGEQYRDFPQVTDDAVTAALDATAR